jgi:hypothetical protein
VARQVEVAAVVDSLQLLPSEGELELDVVRRAGVMRELVRRVLVEPQPVGPLARLINGTLLEAAFFVAASEDPEAARDEVWGAMERLVGGLMRRSSAQR